MKARNVNAKVYAKVTNCMKARKLFVVVAYDISKTKSRTKVAELLAQYGKRMKLIVFECMLTASQLRKLKAEVHKHLNPKKDQVIYYILCMDCFSKIVYDPSERGEPASTVTVV